MIPISVLVPSVSGPIIISNPARHAVVVPDIDIPDGRGLMSMKLFPGVVIRALTKRRVVICRARFMLVRPVRPWLRKLHYIWRLYGVRVTEL